MNIVEEIMIAIGVIEMKNTITLSARNPDSGILFYTDAPHVMIPSI